MIDALGFLQNIKLQKEIKLSEASDESFLEWCRRVSPQLNWDYDWVKHVDKEITRYRLNLIATPPQIGKSTVFTIHYAAYMLCKFPRLRTIIISYNVEITNRFHREILELLEKENIPLYSKSQKEIVHQNLRGSISFCGFNSGITSKPADLVIIDDPIRNAKDAYSPGYQKDLWSGFTTSILSRLQENYKIIITHTRWHENDLIGQILTKFDELNIDIPYNYVRLPAICDSDDDPLGREIGTSVCPQRFSVETFRNKIKLAEGDGEALYQCQPSPPEGNVFKEYDFANGIFTDLEDIPPNCEKFISVDCAFKDKITSDFVSIQKFHYHIPSRKLYLVKVINARLDFEGTLAAIRHEIGSNYLNYGLVEDKANGPAIMTVIKNEFENMKAINPEGGKLSRAWAAQPFVRMGRLNIYRYMDNFNAFINQLKSFPAAPNDDMVDALTQAINYIETIYPTFGAFSEISEGLVQAQKELNEENYYGMEMPWLE